MTSAESRSPGGQEIPPQTKDAPGPDSPLELGTGGWLDTLKRSMKEFKADRCTMTAGSLAYHWFLSLFPAIIALLGLTSLIGIGSSTLERLANGANKALPGEAATVIKDAVKSAQGHAGHGSLTVVILGLVVAIWSASAGMAWLETGLDTAYDVPEDRKFLAKRLYAFPLMLATAVLGGLAAALIVFAAPLGSAIEGHVGLTGTAFVVAWTIVRWLVTVVLVTLLFSVFYFLGPNRKAPHWRWVSPGGLLGSALFLLASVGFSFYVSNFGSNSYSKTYGALAGVVILIFWLYLTGIAVLLGAEVNAEAERQAAAQAGHPAARASAQRIQSTA
jgi:membrane protein